jgi:hypothetical protein
MPDDQQAHGSSLESFLDEEGMLEDATISAVLMIVSACAVAMAQHLPSTSFA